MKFYFYVINYDFNKKKTEMFNIFQNWVLQEEVEKEIKKYLRNTKKYKFIQQYKSNFVEREEIAFYGFEALCKKIDRLIMWQEWSRCEYEISAGEKFTTEVSDLLKDIEKFIKEGKSLEDFKELLVKENKRNAKLNAWDCYSQAKPNIECITRECIYQYKKQLKENL